MTLLRPALVLITLLTLLTGVAYPLLTTALAQWWFPAAAKGSLLYVHGQAVGSSLIGQQWQNPRYFQGRPSATAGTPYNALASGGSNLAVSNPELDLQISKRIHSLRAMNPQASAAVPVELITASASGLDNQLSPSAVYWQLPRVATARGLSARQITVLIKENTQPPLLPFLGQPVVNLIQLNMALDALASQ